MSNTPRTNAATVRMERLDGDIDEVVSAYFARTLERELIAARVEEGATTDRGMLLALMAAFDGQTWQCPACGHAEDTATMDSAITLRSYLATHGPSEPPISPKISPKWRDSHDMKREPVPTGCGAIFKMPEGWSCDCERAHPAPCKANASPTTKEQLK